MLMFYPIVWLILTSARICLSQECSGNFGVLFDIPNTTVSTLRQAEVVSTDFRRNASTAILDVIAPRLILQPSPQLPLTGWSIQIMFKVASFVKSSTTTRAVALISTQQRMFAPLSAGLSVALVPNDPVAIGSRSAYDADKAPPPHPDPPEMTTDPERIYASYAPGAHPTFADAVPPHIQQRVPPRSPDATLSTAWRAAADESGTVRVTVGSGDQFASSPIASVVHPGRWYGLTVSVTPCTLPSGRPSADKEIATACATCAPAAGLGVALAFLSPLPVAPWGPATASRLQRLIALCAAVNQSRPQQPGGTAPSPPGSPPPAPRLPPADGIPLQPDIVTAPFTTAPFPYSTTDGVIATAAPNTWLGPGAAVVVGNDPDGRHVGRLRGSVDEVRVWAAAVDVTTHIRSMSTVGVSEAGAACAVGGVHDVPLAGPTSAPSAGTSPLDGLAARLSFDRPDLPGDDGGDVEPGHLVGIVGPDGGEGGGRWTEAATCAPWAVARLWPAAAAGGTNLTATTAPAGTAGVPQVPAATVQRSVGLLALIGQTRDEGPVGPAPPAAVAPVAAGRGPSPGPAWALRVTDGAPPGCTATPSASPTPTASPSPTATPVRPPPSAPLAPPGVPAVPVPLQAAAAGSDWSTRGSIAACVVLIVACLLAACAIVSCVISCRRRRRRARREAGWGVGPLGLAHADGVDGGGQGATDQGPAAPLRAGTHGGTYGSAAGTASTSRSRSSDPCCLSTDAQDRAAAPDEGGDPWTPRSPALAGAAPVAEAALHTASPADGWRRAEGSHFVPGDAGCDAGGGVACSTRAPHHHGGSFAEYFDEAAVLSFGGDVAPYDPLATSDAYGAHGGSPADRGLPHGARDAAAALEWSPQASPAPAPAAAASVVDSAQRAAAAADAALRDIMADAMRDGGVPDGPQTGRALVLSGTATDATASPTAGGPVRPPTPPDVPLQPPSVVPPPPPAAAHLPPPPPDMADFSSPPPLTPTATGGTLASPSPRGGADTPLHAADAPAAMAMLSRGSQTRPLDDDAPHTDPLLHSGRPQAPTASRSARDSSAARRAAHSPPMWTPSRSPAATRRTPHRSSSAGRVLESPALLLRLTPRRWSADGDHPQRTRTLSPHDLASQRDDARGVPRATAELFERLATPRRLSLNAGARAHRAVAPTVTRQRGPPDASEEVALAQRRAQERTRSHARVAQHVRELETAIEAARSPSRSPAGRTRRAPSATPRRATSERRIVPASILAGDIPGGSVGRRAVSYPARAAALSPQAIGTPSRTPSRAPAWTPGGGTVLPPPPAGPYLDASPCVRSLAAAAGILVSPRTFRQEALLASLSALTHGPAAAETYAAANAAVGGGMSPARRVRRVYLYPSTTPPRLDREVRDADTSTGSDGALAAAADVLRKGKSPDRRAAAREARRLGRQVRREARLGDDAARPLVLEEQSMVPPPPAHLRAAPADGVRRVGAIAVDLTEGAGDDGAKAAESVVKTSAAAPTLTASTAPEGEGTRDPADTIPVDGPAGAEGASSSRLPSIPLGGRTSARPAGGTSRLSGERVTVSASIGGASAGPTAPGRIIGATWARARPVLPGDDRTNVHVDAFIEWGDGGPDDAAMAAMTALLKLRGEPASP